MTWAMVDYLLMHLWFMIAVIYRLYDPRIWGVARWMVIIHMGCFLYLIFNSIQ